MVQAWSTQPRMVLPSFLPLAPPDGELMGCRWHDGDISQQHGCICLEQGAHMLLQQGRANGTGVQPDVTRTPGDDVNTLYNYF